LSAGNVGVLQRFLADAKLSAFQMAIKLPGKNSTTQKGFGLTD